MRTVAVPLNNGRPYEIVVGSPLESLGRSLGPLIKGRRALVVSAAPVARRYAKPLLNGLKAAGYAARLALMPDGERHKTLAVVGRLYREALRAGLDRRCPVIALGGGVVGDVAGFAAATFMRGVPLIHCPTTLLAMVDSSIGGKTGVDLPDGKNLVGAFWQPRLVWADLATLKSLPDRQWRTGVAEMLKYGWIDRRWDVGLDVATVDLKRIRTDLGLLESAVVKAVAAKAGVVARDERETNGERELLNLGHTFGHALETATNYRTYTHGEAISVGMAAAARLAAALGHLDPAGVAEIESTLSHWGLPVRARRKIARGKLMTAMSRDKKNVNGQFRFVVPTREGRARAVEGVPAARVDRTLREVGL